MGISAFFLGKRMIKTIESLLLNQEFEYWNIVEAYVELHVDLNFEGETEYDTWQPIQITKRRDG